MMVSKHKLTLNDTGTGFATGESFWGAILQLRWEPVTADTGLDLLASLQVDRTDTGVGWVFLNKTTGNAADFNFAPRQPVASNVDGTTDTGNAPIVSAGDRIRLTGVGRASGVVGTLYVWTGSV